MAHACPPSYDSHSFISICPMSKEGWEERALLKNCSAFPQTCKRPLEYHCLLNAYRNRSIEVCAPKTRLVQQYCPSYSLKAQHITDQYNCSRLFPDCPKHQYYSTDVLNYTGCLREITSRAGSNITATSGQSFESSQDLYFLFFLLLIPLAALIGAFIWRKRRSSTVKRKPTSINRWRDDEETNILGCCTALRRLLDAQQNIRNYETESAVHLTDHETKIIPETHDHCNSVNPSSTNLLVSNVVTKPFQNSPASEDQSPKCEESMDAEAKITARDGKSDDVYCKDDKIRTDPKPKSVTETINENIQNFSDEKENVEPSEKEQKNGKEENIIESRDKIAQKYCKKGDSSEDVLRSDVVIGNQLAVQTPEDGGQQIRENFRECTGSLSISDTPCAQSDKNKDKDCENFKKKSHETLVSSAGISSNGNNIDQNVKKSTGTFHSGQATDYETFSNGLNKDKESRHSSDTEIEKPEIDIQEEIGNLSDSFTSAFPDQDKLHAGTVDSATSTETCEGQESAVNDENQLHCTLKKMLPTVIEEVITKLGSKFSEVKEYQNIIDDQSWTPAQKKEIRDIRERIQKIEETQNEICELRNQILTLQAEKKSLEESVNDIQKRLHEIQSEKGDEIHKLKTELKETKNLLKKKEEEMLKMKREIEKKDMVNAQLREELKKIKEKETVQDAATKKRSH